MNKKVLALLVVVVVVTAVFGITGAAKAQEELCQPSQIWAPEFVAVIPQNVQTPTSTPKPTRTPDPRPMCTPVPPTATAIHLQPPFTQGVYVPEIRGENQGPDWTIIGKVLSTIVILSIITLVLLTLICLGGI